MATPRACVEEHSLISASLRRELQETIVESRVTVEALVAELEVVKATLKAADEELKARNQEVTALKQQLASLLPASQSHPCRDDAARADAVHAHELQVRGCEATHVIYREALTIQSR